MSRRKTTNRVWLNENTSLEIEENGGFPRQDQRMWFHTELRGAYGLREDGSIELVRRKKVSGEVVGYVGDYEAVIDLTLENSLALLREYYENQVKTPLVAPSSMERNKLVAYAFSKITEKEIEIPVRIS